jgi:hypothetical protein
MISHEVPNFVSEAAVIREYHFTLYAQATARIEVTCVKKLKILLC